MKPLKILALALSLTALSTSVFAQKGIRAGWQNSNVFYGDDNVTIGDNRNFFYIGGYNNTRLVGRFLQFHYGAEYLRNGWQNDDNNYRDIHTVSIPLALRTKLGPFFAQAGFGMNFRLSDDYVIAGVDISDDSNAAPFFDYPAQVGAGLIVGPFVLEARYSYGLALSEDEGRVAYFQLGGAFQF